MADAGELREQFMDVFEDAAYPVTSPMDLIPALPDGPGTTFEAEDFEMTAMELNNEISSHVEFPYQDPESLVDALIKALDAEGYLD